MGRRAAGWRVWGRAGSSSCPASSGSVPRGNIGRWSGHPGYRRPAPAVVGYVDQVVPSANGTGLRGVVSGEAAGHDRDPMVPVITRTKVPTRLDRPDDRGGASNAE